jgi:hypothetical protein
MSLSDHARRNLAQLELLRQAVTELQAKVKATPEREPSLPVLRRPEAAPFQEAL